MKEFVKAMDDLPYIIKLILCIPVFNVIWWVYRIFKSVLANNQTGLILAIILLIIGIPWIWLIDFITMFFQKKVLWFE